MKRAIGLLLGLLGPGTGAAWAGGQLAIGADGLGLISYYDDMAGVLKVAHCLDVACTSARISVLDTSGDVGSESSVAIGADGLGMIAYHDRTNGYLKLAHCANLDCSSAVLRVLDHSANSGWGPSIAIGTDGQPLIAYGRLGLGLMAAHCTDPLCTGAVLSGLSGRPAGGEPMSLALGSDGRGLIASLSYYSPDEAVHLLMNHCADAACTSASFAPFRLGRVQPLNPSLAFGTDGRGLVSYQTAADTSSPVTVRVAHCADVNCSALSTIDLGAGQRAALAIGTDGRGLVGFGGSGLRAAHCANTECSAVATSTLESVRNLGVLGLAIGPDGLGLLAYHDYDSYRLKVAHCQDVGCTAAAVSSLEAPAQADLSLDLRDQPDPVPGLRRFDYILRAHNAGPEFARHVRVSLTLPSSTEFAYTTGTDWDCQHAAGVVECVHPGLLPGADTPNVIVDVTAPPTAQTLTATARVRSAAVDAVPENDSRTEETTVIAAPLADLGVTKDDGGAYARGGQPFTWTITATNAGPTDADGQMYDFFPATVTNTSWTCVASGGASCSPGSTGALVDAPHLPVGGRAVYTATGTVVPGSLGLVNTVTLRAVFGIYDPNPANDRATAVSPGEPTAAYAVAPCRIVDTRAGGSALVANSTRFFRMVGACGVPDDARAVALNATVVSPGDVGDLRLYPDGPGLPPLSSSLNFAAGRTRAGNAIVPLGLGGWIAVRCDMPQGSTGTAHLVLDVYAYFK